MLLDEVVQLLEGGEEGFLEEGLGLALLLGLLSVGGGGFRCYCGRGGDGGCGVGVIRRSGGSGHHQGQIKWQCCKNQRDVRSEPVKHVYLNLWTTIKALQDKRCTL